MSGLSTAIIGGLGGMLGWGSADFFVKKTVDRINPVVTLVWAHFFGSVILVTIALLQLILTGKLIHIPSSMYELVGLIFFGVLQMIVYWLVYEAFGKGKLAVLNPIFASFTGLVALVSVIFLGEVLSPSLAISLLIIFAGVMVINLDVSGLKVKGLNIVPGLKEISLATILATVWTVGWSQFVGRDYLSYALFMYVFMTVAAYLLSRFMKVDLKIANKDSGVWKFLVAVGAGEIIAYLAISLGYGATSFTSVVALISGAFSVPTLILSKIYLKEKVTSIQTIGAIVIILGIVVLSL